MYNSPAFLDNQGGMIKQKNFRILNIYILVFFFFYVEMYLLFIKVLKSLRCVFISFQLLQGFYLKIRTCVSKKVELLSFSKFLDKIVSCLKTDLVSAGYFSF